MANYKVPQDVEADDKLIGPFSFRQFIYLIIVALAGVLAWGLAQLFIGLAVIPLPIILLFGALALPLRKDQPMEIYLAAIISYYLKPHRRLWDPEGIESFIEITAPRVAEVQRTKNITQDDAHQRFSYLADIVDSQGWAIRGVNGPAVANSSMNNDVFLEAQSAQDVLDTSNSVGQSFDSMMSERTEQLKEEARARMFQAATAAAEPPVITEADPATPVYNPYPTDIHQAVVQPVDDPSHVYSPPVAPEPSQDVATTSDNTPSADILNLANNSDISVETIAREAQRIHQKESAAAGEVLISLR